MTRRLSILLSLLVLVVPNVAAAAQFHANGPDVPQAYDYGPSVIYDRSDNKWKMWWCSLNKHGSNPYVNESDGIWYAWSFDQIVWNNVQQVFSGSTGSWDEGHTCDPHVLRNVAIAGTVYPYIMYYTGSKDNSNYRGKIGLAHSADGINWIRHSNFPLTLNCNLPDNVNQLGCQHFSVVKLEGGRFVATYTKLTGNWDDSVYNVESWDGINWTGPNGGDPQRLCFPQQFGTCHATPGVDIVYDPTPGVYYYTFTAGLSDGKVYEFIYSGAATWFGTIRYDLQITNLEGQFLYTAHDPDGTTHGPGFWREANGYRFEHGNPTAPIWTSTGDRNPHSHPITNTKLITIAW